MPPYTHHSTPDDLLARLDALEARVADLEGTAAPAGPAEREGTAGPEGAVPSDTAAEPVGRPSDAPPTPADDADPFWALTALKGRAPSPGAVVFAGAVEVGAGHLEYQWGRPTEHLLAADWAEHAETVAALGHPLRLSILRRLLDGEHTVAQLVDELELASTGVAYHHLSALQTSGWVTSPHRGSWTLSAPRVVPLLAVLIALEKG